jgi:flagellar basal-body rod protein FlgB
MGAATSAYPGDDPNPQGAAMSTFDDIPLMSTLKSQMGYLNQRQKLISQNVANADTPGYTPKDLKSFDKVLDAQGPAAAGALVRTNPMHLEPARLKGAVAPPVDSPDSETRMDGNSVVLEEEMMKMTDSRGDYDTAVTLYEQAMSMIRTAASKPSA